jgi:hypothetical protein
MLLLQTLEAVLPCGLSAQESLNALRKLVVDCVQTPPLMALIKMIAGNLEILHERKYCMSAKKR